MAPFPGMLLSEPAVGEHLGFAWLWVRSSQHCSGSPLRQFDDLQLRPGKWCAGSSLMCVAS
jgi:hypothetical protein